ncbi:hypothetical protein N658DRAFT_220872 [Parathielavia hyrcaniae]|uniref:Uncharacterized protein n=1 Tax=Parathielavia hyrcaniae TaxID=113614 RepID=A0AAN6PWU5_9PEZI|nr:hypothetical protein N658DRAFT_220872 [Parathielavia hyrcaniae]
MHLPRIVNKALGLLVLLAACGPTLVSANKDRSDLCGFSMFTSDFDGIGNFSAIEASWTIPDVASISNGKDAEPQLQWVRHGVSLCCGNDCSTRLTAGMSAMSRDGRTHTAEPVFQLTPGYTPFFLLPAHRFELNASDTFWTRLELLSPRAARITFTKSEGPNSNSSVIVGLGTEEKYGQPTLTLETTQSGHTFKTPLIMPPRVDNSPPTPLLCGDSAWWALTGDFNANMEPNRQRLYVLPHFSPVLIGNQRLETRSSDSKWRFPADLALSGLPRFWNMVWDTNGQTKTLCKPRILADSGMTLLHAPHEWGV